MPEELIKVGYLYVSVTLQKDQELITTNEAAVYIGKSGIDDGILPDLPEAQPNQYVEFQKMYNDIINIGGGSGIDGKSAYQIAVEYGFTGTEEEWLNSLNGVNGEDGKDGIDGHTPQSGIDYFTTEDVAQIKISLLADINDIIPVVAVANNYSIDFGDAPFINVLISTEDTVAKTITVTNVPTQSEIYLELVYNNATAITWFSGIRWLDGTAPTLVVGKTYRMAFFTKDGGASWDGMSVGGW